MGYDEPKVRLVLLRQTVKWHQLSESLISNARALVVDMDFDLGFDAVVCRQDLELAVDRELESVLDQVDQNLLESHLVPDKLRWKLLFFLPSRSCWTWVWSEQQLPWRRR